MINELFRPKTVLLLVSLYNSHDELCIWDLARIIDSPSAWTSSRVHLLKDSGLLELRRVGRVAIVSLTDKGVVVAECFNKVIGVVR